MSWRWLWELNRVRNPSDFANEHETQDDATRTDLANEREAQEHKTQEEGELILHRNAKQTQTTAKYETRQQEHIFQTNARKRTN